MIDSIIAEINTGLAAVPWVENLGGIVVPANRTTRTKDGDELQALPVDYNSDPEACINNGVYKHYVPDSSYASVVFWQLLGPAQQTTSPLIPKRRGRDNVQQLRLSVWANLDNIDINPGEEERLELSLRRALAPYARFLITSPYRTRPKAKVIGDILRDHEVIFAPFYFVKFERMYRYPHVSFALDVEIQWLTIDDCLEDDGHPARLHKVLSGDDAVCLDGDFVRTTTT